MGGLFKASKGVYDRRYINYSGEKYSPRGNVWLCMQDGENFHKGKC